MVLKKDLKDAYKSGELKSSKVKRSGRSVEKLGEIKGGGMTDEEEEDEEEGAAGKGPELEVGVACGGEGATGDAESSAHLAEGPPGGKGGKKELTEVTGGAAAGGSPHGRAAAKLDTSGFGMYGAGCCGDERPDVRGRRWHI